MIRMLEISRVLKNYTCDHGAEGTTLSMLSIIYCISEKERFLRQQN